MEIVFRKDAPLEFDKTADGKLQVSGFAIHPGKYHDNTVEIPTSELRNIAETLSGKQLRKDHSRDTDDVVGTVFETKIAVDKEMHKMGVKYKGVMRDENLEQKIRDGFIDNTSIGFTLYPECSVCHEDFRTCEHWFDEKTWVIARECESKELSIVSTGADANTTIEPGAAFSGESNFAMQFDYKKKEDIEEIFVADEVELEKVKIPPITVNVNFGEEKTSQEDKTMVEEKELQDKIFELEQKLADEKKAKNDVQTELEGVKEQLGKKEGEIITLNKEKNDVTSERDILKKEKEDTLLAEKEKLCKDIAELQVEKGVLEEDKIDEKAEELLKLDEDALKELKVMLEAIKKEEPVREESPVGEFHNQESEKPLPQETPEIDFNDKELRDKMYAEMLGIRR